MRLRPSAPSSPGPPGAGTPRSNQCRLAFAVAFAAVLGGVFFGVGRWTNGTGAHYKFAVPLEATTSAPQASGLIKVGDRDSKSGNWELQLNVAGLPKLSGGDYYVLWL